MPHDVNPFLIYGVFGFFVVAGLVAYERWGLRLGGVLVMPYLVLYAAFDLGVLLLFAVAAAATFAIGEVIHRTTLIYGRRMLIALVLVSLVMSSLANVVFDVSMSGVFLPILPGLYAYNLHREGEPLYRSLVFGAVVVLCVVVTSSVLPLVPGGPRPADPTPVEAAR